MTLEVLRDRVLAQLGQSIYIDMLNRNKSKSIISQLKPPFKISIFIIIDKISKMNEVSSTRELMKVLKTMNK